MLVFGLITTLVSIPSFAQSLDEVNIRITKTLAEGNDYYVYTVELCATDRRILTYDILLVTDLNSMTYQYSDPIRTHSCSDVRIGMYAKNPESVSVSMINVVHQDITTSFDSISVYAEKIQYLAGEYVKVSGFVDYAKPNQSIYINIEGAMGNARADADGRFETTIYAGFDMTPDTVISVSTAGNTLVTNLRTAFEQNVSTPAQNEDRPIPQSAFAENQNPENGLRSIMQQKESQSGSTVTSFKNLYQTWTGKLSDSAGSSETAGMCCFEVTWFNDDRDGNTVTSTMRSFNSGPMKVGESFSYLFDRPGLYPYYSELYPEIKHAIRVYNPATECLVNGGCGGIAFEQSWCGLYGTVENGKCINEDELNAAIQRELQRRHHVFDERENEIKSLSEQKQNLTSNLEQYYKERQDLGNIRYDLGESEYMKKYGELETKMQPVETRIIEIDDKIRDLEQSSNVRFVCEKDPEVLFTCKTVTKSSSDEFVVERTTAVKRIVDRIQEQPEWFQTVLKWHNDGLISDNDLVVLISWLIRTGVIS